MLGLLAALALVALNGFFVAAEFSMVRVRPAKLERLARRGSAGAARALESSQAVARCPSVSRVGITPSPLAPGGAGGTTLASPIPAGDGKKARHPSCPGAAPW